MISTLLQLFPARIHQLILVSDPDGLLGSERVLVELGERGFRVLHEEDPVMLRVQVENARPFTADEPLLIITSRTTEDLPYDLWTFARRITVNLHQYLPTLAYPILRELSSDQVASLFDSPLPAKPLGRQGTADHVLRFVFEVDFKEIRETDFLVAWLVRHHNRRSPLPPLIKARLLEHLRLQPYYAGWPLEDMLTDRQAVSNHLQVQWRGYLSDPAGHKLAEGRLDFGGSEDLQDLLPTLVRKGILAPEKTVGLIQAPDWAKPGIAQMKEEDQPAADQSLRIEAILVDFSDLMGESAVLSRWSEWVAVADTWAELRNLISFPSQAVGITTRSKIDEISNRLDDRFPLWLRDHYGPLGTQRLPVPHHVHHIPHYLADQLERGAKRIALVILDGMALSDWYILRSVWMDAHPDWHYEEGRVLAQIPTITAISRRALVSGRRPAEFAQNLDHLPSEHLLWRDFWTGFGLPLDAIGFSVIDPNQQEIPVEVGGSRMTAICMVDDTFDRLTHGAEMGDAGRRAELNIWLNRRRPGTVERLEAIIENLLDRGFSVHLATDHGHVEALGKGSPADGTLAGTRGTRARLYNDEILASRILDRFPDALLWNHDGLLPNRMTAAIPAGRTAFTSMNRKIVTHGGITIDEVFVPFIKIRKGTA